MHRWERAAELSLRVFALISLLLMAFPFILEISAQTTAQVTVESRTVAPGATTIIRIAISGAPSPGLLEIQVGPKGEFAYDPQVMEVTDVLGLGPYTVTSKTIDNEIGEVKFAASAPAEEALTDGAILELEVRAVGNSGESTLLRLTKIDVLRDAEGNAIPYTVNNGVFSIAGGPNQPPQADFTFSPEQPSTADLIQFTDQSSDPDGEIVSWEWDFGDGTTSTKRNPTHRYEKAGVFTVRLIVTDDRGAIARTSRPLIISEAPPNQPPIAYFTFSPEHPTTEDLVQFTDESTDPDGEITFRFWDFGDGSSSTEKDPTHRYASSGKYTVTLRVADNRGGIDTFSRVLTVYEAVINQPPQAAFTFSPSSPVAGEVVRFLDQSTDSDGKVVMWFWDFGDGATSTLKDPVHRYANPGTYRVTLKVADDGGLTDTASQQIRVVGQGEPPRAGFDFSPAHPKPGELVRFTDRSSDPDGQITSWLWDFGDGATSQEQNPTHQYAKPGVYTVTLTVTDNDGLSDTISKEIAVGKVPRVRVHCYPNPASRETTFVYSLPEGATKAVLRVFDPRGLLVFQAELEISASKYTWDLRSSSSSSSGAGAGEPLPNGPYFYYILASVQGRPARSRLNTLIIQRG